MTTRQRRVVIAYDVKERTLKRVAERLVAEAHSESVSTLSSLPDGRLAMRDPSLCVAVGVVAIVVGCAGGQPPSAPTNTIEASSSIDEHGPAPPPGSTSPVPTDTCIDCAVQSEEPSPATYDRAAASASVARVGVSDCRTSEWTRGHGRAVLVFHSSGDVLGVDLDEPFRDTATGNCVVRRLSRIRIAPFVGKPQAVVRYFTID